jgi:hypothetical protein
LLLTVKRHRQFGSDLCLYPSLVYQPQVAHWHAMLLRPNQTQKQVSFYFMPRTRGITLRYLCLLVQVHPVDVPLGTEVWVTV